MVSITYYIDTEHVGALDLAADERDVPNPDHVLRQILDDWVAARDGDLQSPALSLALEAINRGGIDPTDAAVALRAAADELEVNAPTEVEA